MAAQGAPAHAAAPANLSGMTLDQQPATPYLVVDADVLDGNLTEMAAFAAARGVALRPHAKTHKSAQIARLQTDAGAAGLTLATVAETEIFAAEGFTDIFIAYPLWVDGAKADRLRALLDRCRLTLGVDSAEGARALSAALGADRDRVEVLVEVDSGHHRTGVPPQEAGVLAEQAGHAGLQVRGVFTFPGHSYSPDARQQVVRQEADALARAAGAFGDRGLACQVRSGGSTPTAHSIGEGTLTELRPGVYVFGDAQQLELGTIGADRIALTCVATVVSHAGGNTVLDAGSKALGADRAPWASGYGRLLDHLDARITSLSEHHAVVTWPEGAVRPQLGSRVRVVPNHVCNAVNLADTLVVCRQGRAVERWPVTARGANT